MAGHEEAARILLEYGADPNADTALGTPLMVAAGRDRTELIELLLDHGADLEATGGREERTPLHSAAASGAVSPGTPQVRCQPAGARKVRRSAVASGRSEEPHGSC
ncbi:ankyrin repeat domain-containing protein [Leisingera aquaemixtae]|uniref:ankyrin repeat domain-containing protein n=1 Tax=Leisingera aquaemixtae TaxID=1396826 RepID=UPI0034E0B9CD